MFLYTSPVHFSSPLYDEILSLRNDILRVPLGLSFRLCDIQKEYRDIHFGLYDKSDTLMATAMLTPLSNPYSMKMRQVAVRKGFQGRGLGSLLVRDVEDYARGLGVKDFVLHARDQAVSFYLRMDYKIEGEAFEEVGIIHRLMKKKL